MFQFTTGHVISSTTHIHKARTLSSRARRDETAAKNSLLESHSVNNNNKKCYFHKIFNQKHASGTGLFLYNEYASLNACFVPRNGAWHT